MRILTIRKKKILMVLLCICLVWLGYFSLCLTGKSKDSGKTGDIGSVGKEAREVSQIEGPSLEYLPDEIGTEEYFVNYRIEREKVRSEQQEILNEIVNNPQSGSSVREKAQEKLLSLTQTLERFLRPSISAIPPTMPPLIPATPSTSVAAKPATIATTSSEIRTDPVSLPNCFSVADLSNVSNTPMAVISNQNQ